MKKVILFVILLYSFQTLAQEYPRKEINIRNFIQDIVGNPDGGVNEDLFESLYQNYLNPIDLNKATREQLASVYILSEKQLNSFFSYRQKAGNLLSIYELQAIPDFDLATIYKLVPFVAVKADGLSFGTLTDGFEGSNQYLLLRYAQILETKKGFTEPTSTSKVRYEGSPMKLYARYKMFSSKDFSLGFTLEKDEGETQLTDFKSFHLQFQNKGHWKNITLGDYQLQLGQGLISAAGFYIGKGAETVLTVRRNQLGVRPYTSALENNFFRGAAATYQLGRFDITGFYSRLWRDGNIVVDKAANLEYASSFQTSGLHRTASEIADKNSLLEENIGTDISFKNKANTLQLGFTVLKTNFDKPIQRAEKDYNLYEFGGTSNLLTGLHYNYSYQNFNFFGEVARSSSGGLGMVSGVLASLGKRTDFSVLFRKYDRDFHSFYANGFSENSRNINETGLYAGVKHALTRQWTVSAYADYFHFPWYRYLVDKLPTKGFDYLTRLTYQPNKKLQVFFQFRQENKEENTKITETYIDKGKEKTRDITVVRNRSRMIWIANLDYKISKIWNIQTRASCSTYQFEGQELTQGFAIAQDVNADLGRLSLSSRLAFFKTDDYDNRQYFYEQDVLYAFSFPAYYQHGIRHYLMAQYKISRNVDAWVRWARTDLFGGGTFSSGLEEIPLPHRSEVKVQIRLHF
jgi:Helix-hairpin-helix motif